MQKITEVPNIEPFISGVINLRGKIIPVIDLKKRFGLDSSEVDEKTCIVVVNFENNVVGIIVDEIDEVVKITEENVEKVAKSQKTEKEKFISGIGKINEKIKIILDLQVLLTK